MSWKMDRNAGTSSARLALAVGCIGCIGSCPEYGTFLTMGKLDWEMFSGADDDAPLRWFESGWKGAVCDDIGLEIKIGYWCES